MIWGYFKINTINKLFKFYRKGFLFFCISIFACSDTNSIIRDKHTFLKISPNAYLSKFEVSNLDFVEYLNSLSFKKSQSISKDDQVRLDIVDPKDNYSDIRVIGFYKGDHYYKDGEKMIYRISHKNNSPIYFDSGEFKVHSEYEDFPLVRVSWFGAHNYCSYYGFKLPPAWLWIKAAKEPEFILKNILELKKIREPIDSTQFGVFNLHSNVSEWIEDPYLHDKKTAFRQIRGSSFKRKEKPIDKKLGNFSPQLLDNVGFRPSLILD